MSEVIWSKKLDENWELLEFEKDPNCFHLNCTINYYEDDAAPDDDCRSFAFSTWGMNREEITPQLCCAVCQALEWENSNTCLSGFKAALDYVCELIAVAKEGDEVEGER